MNISVLGRRPGRKYTHLSLLDEGPRAPPRFLASASPAPAPEVAPEVILREHMQVKGVLGVGVGTNGRGLFLEKEVRVKEIRKLDIFLLVLLYTCNLQVADRLLISSVIFDICPRQVWRERVLSVPTRHCLLITDKPGMGSTIFGERHMEAWQQAHFPLPAALIETLQSGDLEWYVRLAAWLLYLRREAREGRAGPLWVAYCALLPTVHTSLLNFETDEERAALQDRGLAEEALAQRKAALEAHAEVLGPEGALAALGLSDSVADSLWAMSTVRSRTFSEKIFEESVSLMVPYVDLANHSSSEPNCLFSASDDGAEFRFDSYRHREKSKEALISYGDRSSQDLMRDYGFVSTGNHADRLFSSREAGAVPSLHEETFLDCFGISISCLRLPGRLNASAWTRDFPNPIARGRMEGIARSLVVSPAATPPPKEQRTFRWPWQPAEDPSTFSLSRERASVAAIQQRIRAAYGFNTPLGSSSPTQDAEEARRRFAAGTAHDARMAAAALYRRERKLYIAEAERMLQVYSLFLNQGLGMY